MTGLVKVGTGTGQLIIPFTASVLIVAFGWRTAYVIIGACVILLLITTAQFLRRDPALMGVLPDGDRKEKEALNPPETGISVREAFRTPRLWTIYFANLAIVFCLMTVILHIVPYATDIGISGTTAAGLISTIGGVSMAGRFITGMAIDRVGNQRSMIFCFILLISALLWLQIARELWMLYLFAVVYGFAHGGFFTTISPLVAEHFGLRSHSSIFGIIVFGGTVGGAVGPVTAGYIFDVTGAYNLAFWICIAVAAVGLGLILSLRR
jgi:predicted MFS family arabinose efflux permease